MKLAGIKKNLKRSHLLLRIWLWAAVRSPYFRDCQLRLYPPPIKVVLPENTCRYGYLRFEVTINRPMLILDIPWTICISFAHARKQAAEDIDLEIIDNIPF